MDLDSIRNFILNSFGYHITEEEAKLIAFQFMQRVEEFIHLKDSLSYQEMKDFFKDLNRSYLFFRTPRA